MIPQPFHQLVASKYHYFYRIIIRNRTNQYIHLGLVDWFKTSWPLVSHSMLKSGFFKQLYGFKLVFLFIEIIMTLQPNDTCKNQKNETDKFWGDFAIKTDHLILAKEPNLMIINKKKKREHTVQWTGIDILRHLTNYWETTTQKM